MSTEQNIRQLYARKHIGNWVFYVPFAYYYVVRLGTPAKFLSWILIYCMPTWFYGILCHHGITPLYMANYFIILCATFTIYELGYILNDTIAIQREKRPSIRLYPSNFQHFFRHSVAIVSSRLLFAMVCLIALWLMNDSSLSWLLTILNIVCIFPLFILYNHIRGANAVWIYPILVFSRYLPFVLPYSPSWSIVFLLWVSFPLLNAIERFSMPAYRYAFMQVLIPNEKSKTLFRVVYYVLVALALSLFFPCKWLLPIYVLGIYRLFVYVLVTYFYTPKNYLQS